MSNVTRDNREGTRGSNTDSGVVGSWGSVAVRQWTQVYPSGNKCTQMETSEPECKKVDTGEPKCNQMHTKEKGYPKDEVVLALKGRSMVESGMWLFFQAPKGRNMVKGKGEILEGIFNKLIANSQRPYQKSEIRNHLGSLGCICFHLATLSTTPRPYNPTNSRPPDLPNSRPHELPYYPHFVDEKILDYWAIFVDWNCCQ